MAFFSLKTQQCGSDQRKASVKPETPHTQGSHRLLTFQFNINETLRKRVLKKKILHCGLDMFYLNNGDSGCDTPCATETEKGQ